MTDINGVLMGLPSHPTVRVKGKPTPYTRPSIALGRTPRSWREIPAHQILPGDIVPGVGAVSDVDEIPGQRADLVLVSGGDGNTKVFGRELPVLAFTARTD